MLECWCVQCIQIVLINFGVLCCFVVVFNWGWVGKLNILHAYIRSCAIVFLKFDCNVYMYMCRIVNPTHPPIKHNNKTHKYLHVYTIHVHVWWASNWWFSKLSNQYTTLHPCTSRHSQDIHKHSTSSCDQHDVSINLIVLVDDSENGLVHQHSGQQPDDQDRDDSSYNLCDCGRGRGRRGTGRQNYL